MKVSGEMEEVGEAGRYSEPKKQFWREGMDWCHLTGRPVCLEVWIVNLTILGYYK